MKPLKSGHFIPLKSGQRRPVLTEVRDTTAVEGLVGAKTGGL